MDTMGDSTDSRTAAINETKAHAYLFRLLASHAPQCEPLPDLMGLCTQIDNLLTALPKWQDIATAPKDGTWFLAFVDGAMFVVHWESDTRGWPSSETWRDSEYFPHAPTHWMPLPASPSLQTQGPPDVRFVDTPLLAAKRRAFDHPTQANLDALIEVAQASPSLHRQEQNEK